MAVYIDKNVFRLDVTVDYIHVMEVFKTEQELRKVESSLIFCELLDFSQVEEHFTTSAKIHDEEQLGF